MDIDGVLLNTVGKVVELYNQDHKTNYVLADMTDWELHKCFGCHVDEIWGLFDRITNDNLWGEVDLVDPYAPELLEDLRQAYDVELVTARTPESMEPVLKRLDTLGCTWDGVRVVDHKNYNEKAKFAHEYISFVDDSPHNYKSITEAGGSVLIYDQPWNRHLEGPRAESMFDVGRKIFYGK